MPLVRNRFGREVYVDQFWFDKYGKSNKMELVVEEEVLDEIAKLCEEFTFEQLRIQCNELKIPTKGLYGKEKLAKLLINHKKNEIPN